MIEEIKKVFAKTKRPYRITSPEYSEWIYLKICCTEEGIKRIANIMATVGNLPGLTPIESLKFNLRRMQETFSSRGLEIPQPIQDAIELELENKYE